MVDNTFEGKNNFGTSPARYSDIPEYKLSSTASNATTGIGARKVPLEDNQR